MWAEFLGPRLGQVLDYSYQPPRRHGGLGVQDGLQEAMILKIGYGSRRTCAFFWERDLYVHPIFKGTEREAQTHRSAQR